MVLIYILKRIRKPSVLRNESKEDQKEGYQKLRSFGTRILDYPAAVLLGRRLFYVHHLGDVLCISKMQIGSILRYSDGFKWCCAMLGKSFRETVAPAAQGSNLARDDDDKVFVSRDVL